MKNKKGFTLIELLAIIVILAIIAVITVPIILNVIENSKKGAAIDSAYGFKDAVNKLYVSELSKLDKQNLKLQGEYSISNGVLNGTGFSNVEIPLSGTKPSSGKLHYTNNVLDDGCLVIGDYKVTFKSDGSINETLKGNCDDYVINGGNQNVTSLSIGDTVNYVTSLNNFTLDDWRVFYIEGDYTYLIYEDYLSTVIESIPEINTYSDRTTMIEKMTNKSNWDSLLTGEINGKNITQTRSDNVWAMGAPTLELWVDSWNSNEEYTQLYTNYSNQLYDSSNGIYYDGYYVGTTPNPTSYGNANLLYDSGYDNTLYFPHKTVFNDYYGYWLASPSANTLISIYFIDFNGYVSSYYGYDSECYTFRPVIKLPTNILN